MTQVIGIIIGILGLIAGILVWLKPDLVARVVSIMFILGGLGVLILALFR